MMARVWGVGLDGVARRRERELLAAGVRL